MKNRSVCQILRMNSLFLILCFISVLPLMAQGDSDTVKLIHITDTHLIFNSSSYDSAWIQKRLGHFGEDKNRFISFFNTIPKMTNADFVAITGDLVDFYEAKKSKALDELVGGQIDQFSSLLFDISNVPVYLTLGNHDITTYTRDWYNQNDAGVARALWTQNAPAFKKGTYYSKLYKVSSVTYRLIFLDNAYFSEDFINNRRDKDKIQFAIDKYQLDWLKNELQKSSEDIEIIFMHIPLSPMKKDDAKETYKEYIDRTHASDLLQVLQSENASVRLIVAGHRHKDDIEKFDFSEDFKFTQILTAPFGHDANNWRLIKLTEESIIINRTGTNNTLISIPINK